MLINRFDEMSIAGDRAYLSPCLTVPSKLIQDEQDVMMFERLALMARWNG